MSNLLPHSVWPSQVERCGAGVFLEVCVCQVLETGWLINLGDGKYEN